MKNIIIITFITILWCALSIIVVATSTPDFYYKAEDKISINIPCFINNTYCSENAQCNISINYPNTDPVIVNYPMENNIAYHTYYLTNATVLGNYQAIMTCNDQEDDGYDVFVFQVNNVGRQIENFAGITFFFVVLLIICIVITIILIVIDSVFSYAMILFSSVVSTWLFFYVYINTIGLSQIFFVLYKINLWLLYAVVLLVLWEVTISYFKKLSSKNGFKDTY